MGEFPRIAGPSSWAGFRRIAELSGWAGFRGMESSGRAGVALGISGSAWGGIVRLADG